MPEQRITLANFEQHLAALQDIEKEIAPEQELEFQLALQQALMQGVKKRDRVAFVMWSIAQQIEVALAPVDGHEKEIQRCQARAERLEKQLDRLKNYVLGVMRTLPKPAKGPRRLEGLTSTLKANGVAPSVDVLDEAEIPLEYKRVTVKMSAIEWEALTSVIHNCVFFDGDPTPALMEEVQQPERRKYEVDRTALLEALKRPCFACGGLGTQCPAGPSDAPLETCVECNGTGKQQIPGARLETEKLRLVIE